MAADILALLHRGNLRMIPYLFFNEPLISLEISAVQGEPD
jgi:hypothetical protein